MGQLTVNTTAAGTFNMTLKIGFKFSDIITTAGTFPKNLEYHGRQHLLTTGRRLKILTRIYSR